MPNLQVASGELFLHPEPRAPKKENPSSPPRAEARCGEEGLQVRPARLTPRVRSNPSAWPSPSSWEPAARYCSCHEWRHKLPADEPELPWERQCRGGPCRHEFQPP